MEILTDNEAVKWCTVRGFDLDAPSHWRDSRLCNGVGYVTKSKQSIVEAFVRLVVTYMEFDEAIVWFTDWPLYKLDEMAVIQRFRASIGEERSLIDAPGHVFSEDEINDCIGLFNLSVQYYWDALLYVPKAKLIAYNSHDEIQHVSSLTSEGNAEIVTLISPFDLTLLKSRVSNLNQAHAGTTIRSAR